MSCLLNSYYQNISEQSITTLKQISQTYPLLSEEFILPSEEQWVRDVENVIREKISNCCDHKLSALIKEFVEKSNDPSRSIREQQLLKKTLIRYSQLSTNVLLQGISTIQRLNISYLIETQIPKINDDSVSIFKRKQWHISHPLLMDKKNIYIRKIGNSSNNLYRRTTFAVCIPVLSTTSESHLVIQRVSRKGFTYEGLETEIREMEIYEALKDSPGIWPMHFWFHYPSSSQFPLEKTLSIMDVPEGNLFSLLNTEMRGIQLSKLLKIAQNLILGLYSMHTKNYVHGSLNFIDVIFKRTQEEFKVGLIGFDSSFKHITEPPTIGFRKGFYRFISYTAPELFKNKDFVRMDNSDYFKTDVWALGCMMYTLYFMKNPAWVHFLNAFYNEDTGEFREVTKADYVAMNTRVATHIEKPFSELEQKSLLSQNEKFECLIYKMMRLDPKKRLDIHKALMEINRLV